jgi:hypothetical protein
MSDLRAVCGSSATPPAASPDDRPELARSLDHLRAGDTLVVWRLDRLGRALAALDHREQAEGHDGDSDHAPIWTRFDLGCARQAGVGRVGDRASRLWRDRQGVG